MSIFIEEINLVSFKGFKSFRLKCSPFTTLVGMNSSGKTSILQSIQLVYDMVKFVLGGYQDRDIKRPNFIQPLWSNDHRFQNSGIIERQNSGDPDALWLNKKTSNPCRIEMRLSSGLEIILEITGRQKYNLDFIKDNQSIRNNIQEDEYQKNIEEFFLLFPIFVPPTASLPPIEQFINYPQLKNKLDKGLIAECWRSYLYWLCNDGDKRNSNHVVEIIQKYLPNTILKLPQLTHEDPPQVLIEFEENETSFDISVSGGGLRTISSLAVILHFSKSRCLLLDEPDAHIHSTLQHEVAQMIFNYSIEKNIQVFATSHAPDFIAEIPVEYLKWIDRTKEENGSCDKVSQFLVNLGAITKADAIRNYGANKILFVEGGIDRLILSKLTTCFCEKNSTYTNPFADSSVIVAELPSGKGDSKHLNAYNQLILGTFKVPMKIACIVDNDYDLVSQTSSIDPLLLYLKRKEIENYLLAPEIIEKTILNLLEEQKNYRNKVVIPPTIEEIENEINRILSNCEIRDVVKYQVLPKYRETLGSSLDDSTKERKGEEWFNKQWSDKEWRIKNCPGKDVLKQLRTWCQKNYGLSLTDSKLIANLRELPDDIQENMEKLQNYFYS